MRHVFLNVMMLIKRIERHIVMKKFTIYIFLMFLVLILFLPILSCSPKVGSTRDFWVDDLPGKLGEWDQIEATLIYQNSRVNIWQYRTEEDKELTDGIAEELGSYFEESSYPEVTDYVYEIDRFFGEKGNRINILFYTPDVNTNWAGYFWAKDLFDDSDTYEAWEMRSNETNVFYLNLDYTINSSNQLSRTKFMKGALTHEFQHMCQAHYFLDTNDMSKVMDSWANEMCSVIMDSMFGGIAESRVRDYNNRADVYENGVRIFNWENAPVQQYVVTSFVGLYMMSSFGDSTKSKFIKQWLENTTSTENYTSVHDLIETLESPNISYNGWTGSTSNYNDNNYVQNKWTELMKDFLSSFVTSTSDFRNYLKTLSGKDITLSTLKTGGTKTLEASSWVIAPLNVDDIESTTGCQSEGTTPAYMIGFNNGIPADIEGTNLCRTSGKLGYLLHSKYSC